MSAVWLVVACGVPLAGAALWASWPSTAAGPARPAQGYDPEPEDVQQSFPMTGAHWLDGFVIFGNTYL